MAMIVIRENPGKLFRTSHSFRWKNGMDILQQVEGPTKADTLCLRMTDRSLVLLLANRAGKKGTCCCKHDQRICAQNCFRIVCEVCLGLYTEVLTLFVFTKLNCDRACVSFCSVIPDACWCDARLAPWLNMFSNTGFLVSLFLHSSFALVLSHTLVSKVWWQWPKMWRQSLKSQRNLISSHKGPERDLEDNHVSPNNSRFWTADLCSFRVAHSLGGGAMQKLLPAGRTWDPARQFAIIPWKSAARRLTDCN